MPESFGARLRQRREDQHIALLTIADETKIKLSLLEALERDDVSHWPSGIFRRAYIRAYAHCIGLNPDVVVREFLELYPEPAEIVEPLAVIASAATGGLNARPPTRFRQMLDSAIGTLARPRRGPAIESAGHAGGPPAVAPLPSDPDFLVVADLCTELGRARDRDQARRLLPEVARILDAIGLIVWVWSAVTEDLKPVLVHGYSDRVLAQLPPVRRDSDNATAAAFRSGQTCAVGGAGEASGALVVPLLAPAGCAGVLAIELPHGAEQSPSVRAVAMVFAALLARLIAAESAESAEQHAPARVE
jgi:transcriptional regulator with XRE-family HTH domain